MLFNLIEVALKEKKKKVWDKVIFFSNVNLHLKITQYLINKKITQCYRKIE